MKVVSQIRRTWLLLLVLLTVILGLRIVNEPGRPTGAWFRPSPAQRTGRLITTKVSNPGTTGADDPALVDDDATQPRLISVTKIWDAAPHNAFTDLVRWRDRFYCAFREGQGHAGDRGNLRIIVSDDGEHWTSTGLLTHDTYDLRDAALSVMPDGRLMVLGGVQQQVDDQRRTGTFVSFSTDGTKFTDPEVIVPLGRWLWRVTVQGDSAYGVSYGTPDTPQASALLKTADGLHYETITSELLNDGERPTEARIRFAADGTAYCLHRRDGATLNSAMLGVSQPPYHEWEWHDLDRRLGGPNFIQIPDGRWIAAGRLYDGGARTELLELNVKDKNLRPILKLPSGGDTSYPGMVWHDDVLWLSYYASHEGRTSIYLAKIAFGPDSEQEPPEPQAAIDIGTRRELFVDDYLIDQKTDVRLRLHHPQPAERVLDFDTPWEGPFCGYATVIKDGDRFRMYYRGLPTAGGDGSDNEVTCYAESLDGIHWEKPDLGLYEVAGSRDNNVVLKGETPASHNFSPFLDTNPAATAQTRYKALGGTSKGLLAFTSPDGIHWTRVQDEPVFTQGIFDSQNVSFWSAAEQQYVCYFRTWTETGYGGFRTVSRTTSKDFVEWSDPKAMTFGDTRYEHLYTNQTQPYFYAPHLYVGVAARFWPGRKVLSAADAKRLQVDPSYFGDISDAVLLTSRGGNSYQRTFMESFIRPGIGLENWVSRTNYPALGVVPTSDSELSIYVQKNYGQPTSHLRRYTLRTDGFASIEAGYEGGEMTTRPLSFPVPTRKEIQARLDARNGEAKDAAARKTTEFAAIDSQSLAINEATVLELPGTQQLGDQVTLAAHVSRVPAGHRRLFSAYNGSSTEPNELILDLNSGQDTDGRGAIRFFYDTLSCGATIEQTGVWSAESGDESVHHIAATWDDGIVKLYFDGKLLTTAGEAGQGAIHLALGNLRLGEDYPPTPLDNEPFLGIVDDILVLRSALSAEQIEVLARTGAASLIEDDAQALGGLLLNMEGADQHHLVNAWGTEVLSLPAATGMADRDLCINFSSSAAGSIRVEIQDAQGNPVPGFTLADADELIGDQLDRVVTWKGRSDLSALAGQAVRFRFVLKDANLYSMRIR